MAKSSRSIIFRADDAGVNPSASKAIFHCLQEGMVRNVGIMVPPAGNAEAVAMFRDLPDGAVLGLHATITSEWDGQRWGPVLGAEAVPSLVGPDGTFHPSTAIVKDHAKPEEVEREVRAQLERVLEWGFQPRYLDTHMVFTWIPGMSEAMALICADHDLVFANSGNFQGLPKPAEPAPTSSRDKLMARIDAASAPGTYVYVSHPSYDGADTKGMFKKGGSQWEAILGNRKAEAEMLCDPAVIDEVRQRDIQSLTYVEASAA